MIKAYWNILFTQNSPVILLKHRKFVLKEVTGKQTTLIFIWKWLKASVNDIILFLSVKFSDKCKQNHKKIVEIKTLFSHFSCYNSSITITKQKHRKQLNIESLDITKNIRFNTVTKKLNILHHFAAEECKCCLFLASPTYHVGPEFLRSMTQSAAHRCLWAQRSMIYRGET